MDALKDRVGAFTEGILIMACPVLVAVALKKVDLRSEGNAAVRGSVSPLAGISLFLSSSNFVILAMASALLDRLPGIFSTPIQLVFRFSKLLVHLCSIFQMLLSYMILLLIATMRFEAFLAVLVVFGPFILGCGYLSVITSKERRERTDVSCDKKLEPSLDFSTSVTSLLFLGLEGLALEGQTGVGPDLNPRLLAPLGFTFFFCVVAITVMLLAAVPPIDYDDQEQCDFMCSVLHVLCGGLTLCFTAVVLTIVFVLDKENGVTVAVVPTLGLFLCYIICLCVPGGNQPQGNEVKPASLELTKVTFTGFLAVSLPSFRDDSLSRYTHAFIISTAMSVLFGLAWRFLTHFKQKAAVWTAKVACLFTHGCLAAAVIPFMIVAMQALGDVDDECHIPCNPSPSEQLNSFIACFKNKAIETSCYTLSSVSC
ncbi:unnamed protein product [Urochloa decumbens]|uniref:Uncharacterized protein n=1 Tax=Urochloa decumbens TaxID=240449 RepID=A0ABC8Z8J6_9POAL